MAARLTLAAPCRHEAVINNAIAASPLMLNSRPFRSMLYMPGANPRALDKAKTLPADALILDLEDAVAPEAKIDARGHVAQALAQGGYGPRYVIARMNGLDTDWGEADAAMIAASAADGLLLPKVNAAEDLRRLAQLSRDRRAGPPIALWAMIETPMALLNLREIAAAAREARLAGLVIGANDLVKDLGAQLTAAREGLLPLLMQILVAARAFGLIAIDAVFNDIADADGFAAQCGQARDCGFDGKTLIHPSQIDIANRAFGPSPADIARAEAIVAAFAAPEAAGKGVLQVEGKMAERLHLLQAQALLAKATAIAAMIA